MNQKYDEEQDDWHDDRPVFNNDIDAANWYMKEYPEEILSYGDEVVGEAVFILSNGKILSVRSHERMDYNTNVIKLGAIRVSEATNSVSLTKKPTKEQLAILPYTIGHMLGTYDIPDIGFYTDYRSLNVPHAIKAKLRKIYMERYQYGNIARSEYSIDKLICLSKRIDNDFKEIGYGCVVPAPKEMIISVIMDHFKERDIMPIVQDIFKTWDEYMQEVKKINSKTKKDEEIMAYVRENVPKKIQEYIANRIPSYSPNQSERPILIIKAAAAFAMAQKETSIYIRRDNQIDDIVDMFMENFSDNLSNVELDTEQYVFLYKAFMIGRREEITRDDVKTMIKRIIGESKYYNMRRIRLTESQLHQVIRESVNRILAETEYGQDATYNTAALQNKQNMIWNADDRNNPNLSPEERERRFNQRILDKQDVEKCDGTIEGWKDRDGNIPTRTKKFGYTHPYKLNKVRESKEDKYKGINLHGIKNPGLKHQIDQCLEHGWSKERIQSEIDDLVPTLRMLS